MPLLGGEFDSEVSSLSTGIQVVFQGFIGMENFKGKELTFFTECFKGEAGLHKLDSVFLT